MPEPSTPVFSDKKNAFEIALQQAAMDIPAPHQEDFFRLIKVLRQINGFRLYFVEIDYLPYRDQLIAQVDSLLALVGKVGLHLDLTTQVPHPLTFTEFEERVLATNADSVVHLLNSESWLAQNVASFNIRRNAIASQANCALVWWLPRAAIQTIAQMAPDAWSWRHGVFAFVGLDRDQLFSAERRTNIESHTEQLEASAATRVKRQEELREMLAQEMDDDLRFPLVVELADLHIDAGHLEGALQVLRQQALPLAQAMVDHYPQIYPRVLGIIADILRQMGEFDEALRLGRDEQLPLYRKLADEWGYAQATRGIADILQEQGDFDQALHLYRDEVLPVFAKLRDIRQSAIVFDKIANIHFQRDEFDEALRIRREEELPRYIQLEDVQSIAITQREIASNLALVGEVDGALDILRAEVLPVFEKLGDVRGQVVTMDRIAECFLIRGQFMEAIRILRDEILPAWRKLGDVFHLICSQLKLAFALTKRGSAEDLAESKALRMQAQQDAQRLSPPQKAMIEGLLNTISVQ